MIDDRERRYRAIRADADRCAGPRASMRMRARGYLDVYHASNGACRFALVAAHGALWASWYLVCAKLAAGVFAVADPVSPLPRKRRYAQFAAYVDVLKEINRLVMVETYALVHTVRDLGPAFAAERGFPADIAEDYHAAMVASVPDEDALRDLYHRHFLWEQDRVVSDRLDDAFAVFEWRLMRGMCQRPWVWFSYFSVGRSMNFRCFTDREERVEKGMIAYDRAVASGLDRLARTSDARLKLFPGLRVWARAVRPAE